MNKKSKPQTANAIVLTASLLLLAACATGRPGGVAPPRSLPASANSAAPIFIDPIDTGFGCSNWAGSKLYLDASEFRQALGEWFTQRGVRIVDSAADARFRLAVTAARPDIEYRLTNTGNGETAWESRETWPYAIAKLRCNTEAKLHLERISAALAAWDGESIVLLPPPPPELSPAERVLADASPNTAVAALAADIERRYAAGELPPDDIPDPNFHLVRCTGIGQADSEIDEYIAFGFGGDLTIACENTGAGQRLLQRRQWECQNQSKRACICGRRTKSRFIDLIKNMEAMTGPNGKFAAVELGSGWLPMVVTPDLKSGKRFDARRNINFSVCSYEAS